MKEKIEKLIADRRILLAIVVLANASITNELTQNEFNELNKKRKKEEKL